LRQLARYLSHCPVGAQLRLQGREDLLQPSVERLGIDLEHTGRFGHR
jgi:hypothetical protein